MLILPQKSRVIDKPARTACEVFPHKWAFLFSPRPLSVLPHWKAPNWQDWEPRLLHTGQTGLASWICVETCVVRPNGLATFIHTNKNFINVSEKYLVDRKHPCTNRTFARSGHMARSKLHWNANYAVGLSKQRKVGLDWYKFLCFGSPTA